MDIEGACTWVWYCQNCDRVLDRDDGEVYPCEDAEDCPSDAFGTSACGYMVCASCHTPAKHVTERQVVEG